MTKRNTSSSPTQPNKPLNGKSNTPRRGDKSKLRCIRNEEELTSTEQAPLDIEPDGITGTNPTSNPTSNRYATLNDDDTSDDDDYSPDVNNQTTIELLEDPSEPDSDSISIDTTELIKKITRNHKNTNETQEDAVPTEPPIPTRQLYPRNCTSKTRHNDLGDNADDDSTTDNTDNHDDTYDPNMEKAQRDFPFPASIERLTSTELHKLLSDRDKDLQDVTKQLQFQPPPDQAMPEATPDPTNEASPTIKKSYVTAASTNPYQSFTPSPIDPTRTVRYGIRIDLPSSPKPLEMLMKAIKTTLTLLQDSIEGPLGIGAWDHRMTTATIMTISDIPDGSSGNKDKQFVQRYFDHWTKANPNKDYTAYMKLRLVTSDPTLLQFPLSQVGANLSDDLLAECKDPKKEPKIFLYKNPLACQAIKPVVVGWLFGSVKSIREDTFVPAVRKELGIPLHVAFGVSWKVLRNEKKKQYSWDPTTKPPQALTIEIEEMYYSIYAPKMSNLWKKRNKSKICGLQLRLIPCFSSAQMAAADDDLKTDSLAMAQKQQHFSEQYTIRLNNPFIASLDSPIPDPMQPDRPWTLRRYLMKAAPCGLPSQRLLVTVDQAWNGDGFHLVTVHPHLGEATRLMSYMIPECLHLYGPKAAKWFNNAGLEATKDITWNPDDRRIVSQDRSMTACVEEDFFGMGEKWKPKILSKLRPTTTATLTPTATSTTAKDIIAQRMKEVNRSDQSIQSFGNRGYQREHDGDTIQTTASALNPDLLDDATVTNDTPKPKVQIDLTGMEVARDTPTKNDEDSASVSTMAQTTGSTRLKLKSITKHNEALAAENETQAAEMEAMENDRADLEARLAAMQKRMNELETSTAKPTKRVSILITPKATDLHSTSDDDDHSMTMEEDESLSPPPPAPPHQAPNSASNGVELADTPDAGVGNPD